MESNKDERVERMLETIHRLQGDIDIEDMKVLISLFPDMNSFINTAPKYALDRRLVLDCCCDVAQFVYESTKGNDTLQNLNVVVRLNKERVKSTPEEDVAEYANALVSLGYSLKLRIRKAGNPNLTEDLDEAIEALNQAIDLPTEQGITERLTELGKLLTIRAEWNSSEDDIEEAIKIFERVIDLPVNDWDDRAFLFDSYGKALRQKFNLVSSTLHSLILAIEQHEKGVECAKASGTSYGGILSNKGNAMLQYAERTHLVTDLESAISVLEDAVKATQDDHEELPARLNNLSNAYSYRFERLGRVADLNTCVGYNRRAVDIARATEGVHSDLAECFVIFGINLHHLSTRIGSTADLEHAINILRTALPMLSEKDPKWAICLSSLGSALVEHSRNLSGADGLDELDEGIGYLRRVVDSGRQHTTNRPLYMIKLGNALSAKFLKTKSLLDLNDCIKQHETAQGLLSDDRRNRAIALVNHGNALIELFQVTNEPAVSDRILDKYNQAGELTASDHPHIAIYESNLGSFFAKKAAVTKSTEDWDAAIKHYEQAFAVLSAAPSLRIGVARDAARLRLRRQPPDLADVAQASSLLKQAVELLPLTSPLSLKRTDQQNALSTFSGLARNAAALILYSGGSAFEALQLLELGSGVMASIQLDARADVTSNTNIDPKILAEFEDLRDQLDLPYGNGSTLHPTNLDSSMATLPERHNIILRLNEIIEKIRTDYDPRFLKGPTEDEFKELASNGPIVVFNVDINRSDAFFVTHDKQVQSLHLHKLRHEKVKKKARQVRNLANSRSTRDGTVYDAEADVETMDKILKWLWKVAVYPILNDPTIAKALKDSTTSDSRPRLWWVTSGWLSLLPIHAAGDHTDGCTENALDRVISSYAPTVKSLRHARRREEVLRLEPCMQALLLSMPETEGQDPLPGAEDEINQLKGLLPSSIVRAIFSHAKKNDINDALQCCHICHFACHGESHSIDPSQSKLLLADWKSDPLIVEDIIRLRPKQAKLAYLSACSAADSRVESLLDESIHLMSSFLLAGFPSVVGTLWSIKDRISVDVATQFYSNLCKDSQFMDVRDSAEALNSAIREIRKQLQGTFDSSCIWAPYIYIGV